MVRCVTVLVGLATAMGCVTSKTASESSVASHKAVKVQRTFSEQQLATLRSFALSESPRLWQTVQTLKAEKAARAAALSALCAEMRSFGRDPKSDPDVTALVQVEADLERSINTIYEKLEAAYIAYKKMLATPGRNEYADMMRIALEDGVQEADATTARYREMSKTK